MFKGRFPPTLFFSFFHLRLGEPTQTHLPLAQTLAQTLAQPTPLSAHQTIFDDTVSKSSCPPHQRHNTKRLSAFLEGVRDSPGIRSQWVGPSQREKNPPETLTSYLYSSRHSGSGTLTGTLARSSVSEGELRTRPIPSLTWNTRLEHLPCWPRARTAHVLPGSSRSTVRLSLHSS